MTITSEPWAHPARPRFRLVMLAPDVLHALGRGDVTGLTPYLTGPECIGLWRRRSKQIVDHPTDAPWITRFACVEGEDAPVGVAGFHGPPDADGMVEVGYRIDPAQRRRGYARSALETLLALTRTHQDVRVIRATIRPNNEASLALVKDYEFVQVGEQWDDEDGRELVFEVGADGQTSATSPR